MVHNALLEKLIYPLSIHSRAASMGQVYLNFGDITRHDGSMLLCVIFHTWKLTYPLPRHFWSFLKRTFLVHRCDILVPWRVIILNSYMYFLYIYISSLSALQSGGIVLGCFTVGVLQYERIWILCFPHPLPQALRPKQPSVFVALVRSCNSHSGGEYADRSFLMNYYLKFPDDCIPFLMWLEKYTVFVSLSLFLLWHDNDMLIIIDLYPLGFFWKEKQMVPPLI